MVHQLTGTRGQGITIMAFTDSGWMRRFRVPRLALTALAVLQVTLTLAAVLSTSFAVWAGSHLRRLGAVHHENRALTLQLRDQARLLHRLQGEMARLRELEKGVRAASGLPHGARANGGTGEGEGPPTIPPR